MYLRTRVRGGGGGRKKREREIVIGLATHDSISCPGNREHRQTKGKADFLAFVCRFSFPLHTSPQRRLLPRYWCDYVGFGVAPECVQQIFPNRSNASKVPVSLPGKERMRGGGGTCRAQPAWGQATKKVDGIKPSHHCNHEINGALPITCPERAIGSIVASPP